MSVKVSVIVPVYNAEKTIQKCIDGLLAQTCGDYEAIFVDDGSTDNSEQLLNKICKKNKNFYLISQNNAGAAAARNVGIDKAKGEYICFVDADDEISPNYIKKMLEIAAETKADVVCAKYINSKSAQFEHLSDSITKLNSDEAVNALLRMNIVNGPVAKLYRRSMIGDARMPDYRVAEDLYFNYEVFKKARLVVVNDSVLYNYVVRPGSLSTGRFSVERMQSLEAVEKIDAREKSNASMARVFMEAYFICESILLAHSERKYANEYKKVCGVLIKGRKKIIKDKQATKRQKLVARLLAFGPKIAVNVMTAKNRLRN